MKIFKFAPYFENEVLRKRPYLSKEMCVRVVQEAVKQQEQSDGRIRFWAAVPELGSRFLRVVTLHDGVTILNAFPDRGFKL